MFKRTHIACDFPFHYEYPFSELFWKTDDGTVLNGLHFTVKHPKGVILFLHGNSGHMGRSGSYFKRVKDLDFDVVLYDYRGYGKSTGTPSKATFYSDALLVYDWVKQQYPLLPIVVHGLSLGSHVAASVAAHRAISLLILETPFLNLLHIAQYRYPILPARLLLRNNMNSAEFLPLINCPIYVFHGDNDTVVPLSEAQRIPLYNGNVKMIVIRQGTHKNLHEFSEYQHTLEAILKALNE